MLCTTDNLTLYKAFYFSESDQSILAPFPHQSEFIRVTLQFIDRSCILPLCLQMFAKTPTGRATQHEVWSSDCIYRKQSQKCLSNFTHRNFFGFDICRNWRLENTETRFRHNVEEKQQHHPVIIKHIIKQFSASRSTDRWSGSDQIDCH